MRAIFYTIFIVLVLVKFNDSVKPEVMEDSEDWKEISKTICKTELSKQKKDELQKCNELDPYYKLDSYSKTCDKLRAPPGSSFYDEERGECRYQECYDKAIATQGFKDAEAVIVAMKEDKKVTKTYERYVCIRKVLGLKIPKLND